MESLLDCGKNDYELKDMSLDNCYKKIINDFSLI